MREWDQSRERRGRKVGRCHHRSEGDSVAAAEPAIVEITEETESSELDRREQRRVRFAAGGEEVPVREPLGSIAGFITEGAVDDASMLLICERGMVKPITETREGGETFFECAARGASEEASPLLQQAMLARTDRSELTRFNGTPVFVTRLKPEAVQMTYKPSQSPSETTGMPWYSMRVLLNNTGPVELPDLKGVTHNVSRDPHSVT